MSKKYELTEETNAVEVIKQAVMSMLSVSREELDAMPLPALAVHAKSVHRKTELPLEGWPELVEHIKADMPSADTTVTVHNGDIHIRIPKAHMEHLFSLEEEEEGGFRIKDMDKYTQFAAEVLREESCPHTGATLVDLMFQEVNNTACDHPVEDSGVEEIEEPEEYEEDDE